MLRNPLVLVTFCLLALLGGCDSFTSAASRLQRAGEAERRGDFAAALVDLRRVLKDDPANGAVRLQVARLEMQSGNTRAAQDELARARRDGANTPEAATLAGEVALGLGQGEQLLKQLADGTLKPPVPQDSLLRGRAYLATGHPVEAQAAFERALAVNADLPGASVGLAQSLAAQGKSEEALTRLAAIVRARPTDAQAALSYGQILIQRGQYADAEAALSKAREKAASFSLPQRFALLLGIADAQMAQGKVPAAEETQKALAAVAPDAVLTRLVFARIKLAKGEYAPATAELQRVVVLVPDYTAARMLLGAAHFAQGNYQQAELQLQQVVQQAPDNLEARKLLARVQLQLDLPEAALSTLPQAFEQGADPELYALLGAASRGAGGEEKALAVLERSVQADPNDPSRKLELAAAYLRARRYQNALTLLKTLPSVQGSARREAMLLTALMADQGPVVARNELNRLLAQQPDNRELRFLAIGYFISQREFERARADLSQMLETSPNDMRALITLAGLESLDGRGAQADAALKRALAANPQDTSELLALAQLFMSRGDVAGGRTLLDKSIAAAQGRADVVNAAGELLLRSQRFDEALARFRRATELEPAQAMYWFNTARAQTALDQTGPARESVTKALQLRPDWVPAVSLLTLIDLRTEGAPAALARARELRAHQPREAAAIVLEGDVLMNTKDYTLAARAYEDAERIAPDASTAMKLFEAMRLANQSRPEAPLNRWLAVHPEDVRVHLALAQFYGSTGRADRAAAELENVVRWLPSNPFVLNNLAWRYLELGDSRAEATARKAYELAPKNVSVADTYGWVLFQRRKPAEALPVLESAARAAPTEKEIQYHYAAALASAGRRAEAKELLQRLVQDRDFTQRREAEKLLQQLTG